MHGKSMKGATYILLLILDGRYGRPDRNQKPENPPLYMTHTYYFRKDKNLLARHFLFFRPRVDYNTNGLIVRDFNHA